MLVVMASAASVAAMVPAIRRRPVLICYRSTGIAIPLLLVNANSPGFSLVVGGIQDVRA
jgi:hypothetical protein